MCPAEQVSGLMGCQTDKRCKHYKLTFPFYRLRNSLSIFFAKVLHLYCYPGVRPQLSQRKRCTFCAKFLTHIMRMSKLQIAPRVQRGKVEQVLAITTFRKITKGKSKLLKKRAAFIQQIQYILKINFRKFGVPFFCLNFLS
jgi:hypothetical protein